MTPEQQVLQQIEQILASNQLENRGQLDELAEQLAEICRQANERLLRCSDYLDKGRRSEAVYEARLAPDLLVLASQMEQCEALKRWKNLCQDMELPVFQPLNKAVLDRISEAAGNEMTLEPLLKEYRRSVYQSNHLQCIDVLRRIRELDPLNPSWEENLRPLEESYLPGWIDRAERGLRSMDLQDLKIVFQELNHPRRAVMPPPELMMRLRRALLSERAADLRAEGKKLLVELKEAMEAEAVTTMEALWAKCSELEKDEAFMERPAGWNEVIAESHDRVDRIHARLKKEEEFKKALSSLKDMLMEGKVSALELRHEYERLQAMGLPVPEMTARQVKEVLAQKVSAKRRRGVMIGSMAAAVIAVIVAVSLFLMFRAQRNERRNQWLAKAEQFADGEKLAELAALMDEIKLADAELYNAPELVGYRNAMQEKSRVLEKKRRDFLAFRETLEDIRQDGYRGDANSIRRALDDAEAAAVKDDEKEYVLRWKTDWMAFTAAREKEMDSRLIPVLEGLVSAAAGVKSANGDRIAGEISELEKLRQGMEIRLKAAETAQCSQDVRSRVEQFRSSLDRRIADAKGRHEAWRVQVGKQEAEREKLTAEQDKLRRDIASAMPNMERYESLLKSFVEIGDGTPEQTDYKQLLKQFQEYRSVLALNGISLDESMNAQEIMRQLQPLLASSSPASSSIWQSDLKRLADLFRRNTEMQRKVSSLMNLREDSMYVLKCRRIGETEWTRYYSERPIQTQQKDGVVYYWGASIYWASEQESRVVQVSLSELNGGNNLSSAEYDVVYSRVKEDNLAEHVKVMRRLVAEILRSNDVLGLVLGEVQKMRNNGELDPVQRLLMFKRLAALLASSCGDELPESRDWVSRMKEIDTDIPWQNAQHPRTVAVRRQIEDFWKSIPDLNTYRQRLQFNRQLLIGVLMTGLRCIGSVQLDAKGNKVFVPREQGSELWAYAPGINGALPGFRILAMTEQGTLEPDALAGFPVGMPVYSPVSGHEITALWNTMKAENPEMLKTAVRPRALPVNVDAIAGERRP